MTRWRTAPARAGWALALGGACVGGVVLGLGMMGGTRGVGLLGWWLLGGLFGLLGIVAWGGPAWWLAWRLGGGRRGPVAAGVTGAAAAAVATMLVLAQNGLAALAMAAVAAMLGALPALAMWLVAYRAD